VILKKQFTINRQYSKHNFSDTLFVNVIIEKKAQEADLTHDEYISS